MKNKIDRKNSILKSSIDLMYLHGYNGTSVKDITVAAGIPKGSFYNYFEDKEHYAVDALEYYFNIMKKTGNEILMDKNRNPLDRIIDYFLFRIDELELKGLKYGCLAGNLAEEMGDISDLISKATADIDIKMIDMVNDNLIEAKDQEIIKTSIDLRMMSSFILSSWQGAMLRMKMNHNKDTLIEFITILKLRLTSL